MSGLVCNYDSHKNLLFVQKHRCGTSMLHDLAESGRCPGLGRYTYLQLFENFDHNQLAPDTLNVVAIFRHPVRNFLSALNMIFDGTTREFLNPETVNNQRYDLGEAHAEIGLAEALILGAAGYNVKFLRLTDYTEFLLKQYANSKDLILSRHKDNSFDPKDADTKQIKLWLKYQEYINSNQFSCEDYSSWDEWIEPELKMFEYYLLCEQALLPSDRQDICVQALDYLFKHQKFWGEITAKPSKPKSYLELVKLLNNTYPGCLPESVVSIAEHQLLSFTPL